MTETTATPLHLDRVRNELRGLAGEIVAARKEAAEALASGAWKTSAAVGYFTPSLVRAEVFEELYRLVRSGGASAEAWGNALTAAMRYATEHTTSTSPLANALTALRQDSARKWVTANQFVWPELPHQVLAWAPFRL